MSAAKTTSFSSQLTRLIPQMTEDLRKLAIQAGWPSSVVSRLSVKIDGTKVIADYPLNIAQQVGDLEYGTTATPPKPVFRVFVDRQSVFISAAMTEWSLDNLVEEGAIP